VTEPIRLGAHILDWAKIALIVLIVVVFGSGVAVLAAGVAYLLHLSKPVIVGISFGVWWLGVLFAFRVVLRVSALLQAEFDDEEPKVF
jgi:hypothetical protein